MATMREERYTIRVRGHLSRELGEWFRGLEMCPLPGGETELSGVLRDQAALYGVLLRIRDVGLTLLSVTRDPPETGDGRAPICSP